MGALTPDGLVRVTPHADGLVEETPHDVAVGALSPDGLVGETPLEIYEAVGALSPDGLTPLISYLLNI